MAKTRTKKATLNIMTSALLEVLTMLSGLILPQYILRYFGSAYNGIMSSAVQFMSMISVLTLGVTASTRVALYKTLAQNDIAGTSAIVRATERFMRKIALILVAYIVVLALVYPLVVHTGFSYCDVSLLILIVGINIFAECYFGITYRTFLLADQSLYISNIFYCIALFLNLVISIIMIKAGYSIQMVRLGGAVVYFLRPLLQNIYITKKYKLDKHCEPDMSALNSRSDAMMHTLANIVHDHTDIIVLTLFTDVKIVSVYTVYNMVMVALKKLLSIFTTDTEPIFGSMWANGENNKIRKNLSIFEFLVNSFNVVAFGTAMVMILSFMAVYVPENVKDVNYILPGYSIVISLAFVTQGMRIPYLSLVQGIGHYKQTKKAAITEAVINIIISVILVNIIGIVGVAVGTLVANVYRSTVYALYIEKNVVQRGKYVFIMKFLWSLLCIAVIVIPAKMIVQTLYINNWGKWFMVSFCVGVYAAAVILIAGFLCYREDLKNIVHLAKTIIGKRI